MARALVLWLIHEAVGQNDVIDAGNDANSEVYINEPSPAPAADGTVMYEIRTVAPGISTNVANLIAEAGDFLHDPPPFDEWIALQEDAVSNLLFENKYDLALYKIQQIHKAWVENVGLNISVEAAQDLQDMVNNDPTSITFRGAIDKMLGVGDGQVSAENIPDVTDLMTDVPNDNTTYDTPFLDTGTETRNRAEKLFMYADYFSQDVSNAIAAVEGVTDDAILEDKESADSKMASIRSEKQVTIDELKNQFPGYMEETQQAMQGMDNAITLEIERVASVQQANRLNFDAQFRAADASKNAEWSDLIRRVREAGLIVRTAAASTEAARNSADGVVRYVTDQIVAGRREVAANLASEQARVRATLNSVTKQVKSQMDRVYKHAKKVLVNEEMMYKDEADRERKKMKDTENESDDKKRYMKKYWDRALFNVEMKIRRLNEQASKLKILQDALLTNGEEILATASQGGKGVNAMVERELKTITRLFADEMKSKGVEIKDIAGQTVSGVSETRDTAVDTYTNDLHKLIGHWTKATEASHKQVYKMQDKFDAEEIDAQSEIDDVNGTLRSGQERFGIIQDQTLPAERGALVNEGRKRGAQVQQQMSSVLDRIPALLTSAETRVNEMLLQIDHLVDSSADVMRDQFNGTVTEMQENWATDYQDLKDELKQIQERFDKRTDAADYRSNVVAGALETIADAEIPPLRNFINEIATEQLTAQRTRKDTLKEELKTLAGTARTKLQTEARTFAEDLLSKANAYEDDADTDKGKVEGEQATAESAVESADSIVKSAKATVSSRLQEINTAATQHLAEWGTVKTDGLSDIADLTKIKRRMDKKNTAVADEMHTRLRRLKRSWKKKLKTDVNYEVERFLKDKLEPMEEADEGMEKLRREEVAAGAQEARARLHAEHGRLHDRLEDLREELQTTTELDADAIAGVPALKGLEETVRSSQTRMDDMALGRNRRAKELSDLLTSRGESVDDAMRQAALSAELSTKQMEEVTEHKIRMHAKALGYGKKELDESMSTDKAMGDVREEVQHLRSNAALVGKSTEYMTKASEALWGKTAEEMRHAGKSVGDIANAEALGERLILQDENKAAENKLDTAHGMLFSIKMMKEASHKFLNETAQHFQSQYTRAKAQSAAYLGDAEHKAKSVLDLAASIHQQNADILAHGEETAARVAGEINDTKRAYNRELQKAAHLIAEEQKNLTALRGEYQYNAERAVDKLIKTTQGTVDDMHVQANKSDVVAVAWRAKHAAFEKRLRETTAMEHDGEQVEDLAAETDALDADHAQIQQWSSTYNANSLAYESEVSSKLATLGGKVPKATSRALPQLSVQGEFDGLAAAADQELHATLAHFDSQILAVLKDDRLSEAEQQKRVAELKQQQAADAARIHAEQLQTAQAEAAVTDAVDRFDALTASAEAAAQRVEADMTPQAQAVRHQLRNLTDTLTHLEQKPLLQSALQVSDRGIDPAYGALAQANADLRAQIVKAEGVLAARSR